MYSVVWVIRWTAIEVIVGYLCAHVKLYIYPFIYLYSVVLVIHWTVIVVIILTPRRGWVLKSLYDDSDDADDAVDADDEANVNGS